MNLAQLQALAQGVGFPDPALAAAVAMAESGGNPCAQGDPNIGVHSCSGPNGTSEAFGLWQVNVLYNTQYDPTSLLDPTYNAKAALAISSNGTNWNPWTTYRTGAYRPWYSVSASGPILLAASVLLLSVLAANAILPGSVPIPRMLRV